MCEKVDLSTKIRSTVSYLEILKFEATDRFSSDKSFREKPNARPRGTRST